MRFRLPRSQAELRSERYRLQNTRSALIFFSLSPEVAFLHRGPFAWELPSPAQGRLSEAMGAQPLIKDHGNTLNIIHFEALVGFKSEPANYLCRKITQICHGAF